MNKKSFEKLTADIKHTNGLMSAIDLISKKVKEESAEIIKSVLKDCHLYSIELTGEASCVTIAYNDEYHSNAFSKVEYVRMATDGKTILLDTEDVIGIKFMENVNAEEASDIAECVLNAFNQEYLLDEE